MVIYLRDIKFVELVFGEKREKECWDLKVNLLEF